MKAVKNTFMAIFVLIISTGIFYFTIHDKKLKENILDSTLGIIGEQLLAIVPNSPQKDTLKKRYQTFLGQVENEELNPDKIELVAAGMINIVNKDTVNMDELLTLFDVNTDSTIDKIQEPDITPPELADKRIPKPPTQFRPFPKPWTDDDYRKVGTKLKHIQEFHDEMARSIDPKDFKERFFVVADSGLQIIMDDKIRTSIKNARKHNLDRQLAELERNNLIDFRYDYEKMKRFQMAERDSLLHIQLDQLEKNISRMLKKIEDNKGWFQSLTPAQQDSIKNIIKKESKVLKTYKSKPRKQ